MKLIPVRNKPHLYRHPKTEIIYFRMYRQGLGELVRSTKETVLSRAEIRAERIRSEFLGEKFSKKLVDRRLFEEQWPEFLEIKKNKSKSTYSSMEIQGRVHLLPFFGDMFPHEINEAVWEQYIAHSAKHTPGRKLFNDWKCVNMFLLFLYRGDRLPKVPKLRNPDPETKAGKVYSDHEIAALISHSNSELRIQILMAVTMGMRLSEILFLTWDRVNFDKHLIHLRAQDTKIRKARSFAISLAVWEELFVHRQTIDVASPYVFPSPLSPSRSVGRGGNKTAWRACKRRADVRGRFHDLRHTFLTKAFKKSVNPALICEYAGLSISEAQRTYLHFTVEDTRTVSTLVSFE